MFLGGAAVAIIAFRLGAQASRGEPMTIRPRKGRSYMKSEEQEAAAYRKLTGEDKVKQKMIAQLLDEAEKTP